ncbi:MAG: hypothetical protein R2853_03850 [Thermomicrobiales bacterium]
MDITLLPAQHLRTVRDVKSLVREWVTLQAQHWPDLRAAHLTGGITALEDDDLFPSEKDVDLHLIFPEQSAILRVEAMPLLETQFAGLAIEAGLKPMSWYRSPQAVLGNPEIAYHLTRDTILFDPAGLLRALQPEVRRRYAEPDLVRERIAWERRGQEGVFALCAQLEHTTGPVAALNVMGYTVAFATAALSVARLAPPRQGGRVFLHLRQELVQAGRPDLYEAVLEALGLAGFAAPAVRHFLREASEQFDMAVRLRESGRWPEDAFGPFSHKLHRRLRPYFVHTCQSLLQQGWAREAMGWVLPYHLATSDMLLGTLPASEHGWLRQRQEKLQQTLGLELLAQRQAAITRLREVYAELFAVADSLVELQPAESVLLSISHR